eukprot:TRINITY_DN1029_c0_g1_i1.p1 TRINITY_DN1029_c0_g1~~TRINITY_DN1029_c0_g1_i1.p1  ORF type:complete len:536 (+),score=155.22 TRINITY_DN1029_c0_g1_i1:223-1608(+)
MNLESNANFDDKTQAYAAGYLEGWVLMKEIYQSYTNFYSMKDHLLPPVKDFPKKNLDWMRRQIQNGTGSQYWTQVNLVLEQTRGILDGYNKKCPTAWRITENQFIEYQMGSELGDINQSAQYKEQTMEDLHCSVLVRVSPDGKELFATHNTWATFSRMLRTWRNVKLNFKASSNVAKAVSYSGHPGTIPSDDDFFITDQQLIVMETTNSVYNQDLFKLVTPETVPYWIRVTIANRMASSGKEWNHIFGIHNSGTYNNQWIVVDNKKFTPGKPLTPDTLWITEQIPGNLYGHDQTEHLSKYGFWASYNVAYYPYIYNISGYPEHVAKNGNGSSYEWCPRAQIFRRDAPSVKTLGDMKKIIRYNQYQTDPLSLNNACNGVAARCDLNTKECPGSPTNTQRAFGAIDAKLTSNQLAKTMSAEIISGPTWDSQPPFAWTSRWSNYSSLGMPRVYAFDWIRATPKY